MPNGLTSILKNYHLARHFYRLIRRMDLYYSNPASRLIEGKRSQFDFKRINLVLPSINEEHFFGGVATALKIFEAMIRTSPEKLKSRIILTDAVPRVSDLNKFPGYQKTSWATDTDLNHQILSIPNNNQKKIFLTRGDRFLATAWWTAYSLKNAIRQQVELFDIPEPRMAYVIQDFEPGFYGWSSPFALAESTYHLGFPTMAIFNSSFLRQFFARNGYTFFKEFVFEPRLNDSLMKFLCSSKPPVKEKRILCYGRPTVARNCFPLIVEALKNWIFRDPHFKEWEILSIGEMHPPIELGQGIFLKSRGKLTLSEYAELLLTSAVGISLMVSPHPSYPPLEMAHFGLLTITNGYANKDLSLCHDNISSIQPLSPDAIMEALLQSTKRFNQDPETGWKGKSYIPYYLQEDDQFPFISELLQLLWD
jgi:O-antigen biosynthesis protein